MSDKESPKNVINGYRKRQETAKRAPLIFTIAAVLLVLGAVIVIIAVFNPGLLSFASAPTETPTATNTLTATPTSLPTATSTATPTITEIPTETATLTPSGPFTYEVVEGDSCYAIAAQFEVDILLLITINNLDPSCPIIPGNTLIIPGPDTELPTATPLPAGLPRGFIIEYKVLPGDTIAIIAGKFNSTEEAIIEENEIENPNEILVGQVLRVPVNLVTPVPTETPVGGTQTPTPSG
jgi:LysM repeat protein